MSPLYHAHQQQRELYAYPVWGVRQNKQAVWLHYIVVTVFCFAVGMLNEAFRQRLAREEVEYERNKAELALYKAQINPHFLFNTLNTLYGLLITHSDKTEATLVTQQHDTLCFEVENSVFERDVKLQTDGHRELPSPVVAALSRPSSPGLRTQP